MSTFSEIAQKIIAEQEKIIGPIALEQADRVTGLVIDHASGRVQLNGDESVILNNLVEQYRNFFGQASVEVCKAAVRDTLSSLPAGKIPALLR